MHQELKKFSHLDFYFPHRCCHKFMLQHKPEKKKKKIRSILRYYSLCQFVTFTDDEALSLPTLWTNKELKQHILCVAAFKCWSTNRQNMLYKKRFVPLYYILTGYKKTYIYIPTTLRSSQRTYIASPCPSTTERLHFAIHSEISLLLTGSKL